MIGQFEVSGIRKLVSFIGITNYHLTISIIQLIEGISRIIMDAFRL